VYTQIMAVNVRTVDYYYTVVQDRPGQAAELLSLLSQSGVDMLAFSIVPTGPAHTQLQLYPASANQLLSTAKRAGLDLTGPQHALLVQGEDELGALVDVHRTLADHEVNVYASSGVVTPGGGFGYVLYVRPEDYKKAAQALGLGGVPSWRPEGPLLKK
jgi:hypothetical protein